MAPPVSKHHQPAQIVDCLKGAPRQSHVGRVANVADTSVVK